MININIVATDDLDKESININEQGKVSVAVEPVTIDGFSVNGTDSTNLATLKTAQGTYPINGVGRLVGTDWLLFKLGRLVPTATPPLFVNIKNGIYDAATNLLAYSNLGTRPSYGKVEAEVNHAIKTIEINPQQPLDTYIIIDYPANQGTYVQIQENIVRIIAGGKDNIYAISTFNQKFIISISSGNLAITATADNKTFTATAPEVTADSYMTLILTGVGDDKILVAQNLP